MLAAALLAGCGGGEGSSEAGRVVTPSVAIPPLLATPDPEPTSEPAKPVPSPPATAPLPEASLPEMPLPETLLPIPSGAIVATPATVASVLAAARGGDLIVLAAGDYDTITLPRVKFSTTVRIDASRARLSEVVIYEAGGIDWTGGRLVGEREQWWGVRVDFAERVRISGMTLSGAKTGIGVSRSTDVEVADNRFDGIRSDGVNIAMSQRVKILRNLCVNFDPVPTIYNAAGKVVTDGDHPDCVQGWSRIGYPLTADVTIEDNIANGLMQGVWFEDYGDGGYDRIIVRGNNLTLGMFQGINILNGRDVVITSNRVRPVPGSRLPAHPHPVIRPWIRASGEKITLCGNKAESYGADDDANRPC